MDINNIRESLKDYPHIKSVWVTDNGYYTVAVAGAVKIDLENTFEVVNKAEETISQDIPVKQRKRKDNGTK